ncbi:MAG: delta(1)-pyrroline-2-carboxylate reductase family protein [Burkholderiales bacterium]|nr:delta(1)-pyrroline-2-carboxylate reductase family protein [Burkholderiales bacterium]
MRDPSQTADRLAYPALLRELRAVLADGNVRVPERMVQPLPGGGTLFLMPAHDAQVAITKLITYTPANAGTARPAIQGDVIVFDIATGERRLVLDGPTVTARRTAAVSLLAAQLLAPNPDGPLLVVGAGAQGRSHLDAFAQGLPLKKVLVASRSRTSAQALAEFGRSLGLQAEAIDDPHAVLADCPLVVTCTPADRVVLRGVPRDDAFIAAIGAFTPRMAELDADLCRHFAAHGRIVLDTDHARHEAGDLIQAGLDLSSFASLKDIVANPPTHGRPVLFKSCGWAGWDLAAARAAMRRERGERKG